MHKMATRISDPRSILLIDAIGGLLTAITIFGLFAMRLIDTGIPTLVLYMLSMAGVAFAVFDFYAYRKISSTAVALRIIGMLNLTYCAGTIIAIRANWLSVNNIAITYFSLELLIIATLAAWELNLARRD